MLGAKISAGNAYKYGQSVADGRAELRAYINTFSLNCPDTHYILAGYSQGAQVISTTLPQLPADKITYAATLGDPKLYLPEGISQNGQTSPACLGQDFSDYRINVPDCQVVDGILDANIPYRPETYKNKVGTWCNYADFICGSKFDFSNLLYGHTSYVSSGRYAEVAKHIASAIQRESANNPDLSSSTTNLALVINYDHITASNLNFYQDIFQDLESTSSTANVYSYGKVYNISTTSALQSAIEHTSWQTDATKNITIVSSAPYSEETASPTISLNSIIHLANLCGITISVITSPESSLSYQELVYSTGGELTTVSFPTASTQHNNNLSLPTASYSAILSPKNSHNLSLVIINDAVIGFTDQTELTITDLSANDKVVIIPIDNSGRRQKPLVYYYDSIFGLGSIPINLHTPNSGVN